MLQDFLMRLEKGDPTVILGLSTSFACFFSFLYTVIRSHYQYECEKVVKNSNGKLTMKNVEYSYGSKIISLLFAIIIFTLTVYNYFFNEKIVNDEYFGTSALYFLQITIAVGYFIFDVFVTVSNDTWTFIIHAWFSLLTFIVPIFFLSPLRLSKFYCGVTLLEGSTIFLNWRWLLIIREKTATKLFTAVNVAFVAAYVAFRLAFPIYHLCYLLRILFVEDFSALWVARENMGGVEGVGEIGIPVVVKVWLLIAACISFSLNLKWFGIILTSLFKKRSPKNKPTHSINVQQQCYAVPDSCISSQSKEKQQ